MIDMKVRSHVYVSGRVQGVFYRSSTKYKAISHNVTGLVRNLSDGRVEAIFEGEMEDVKILVDFCKKGSRWAKVVNVEVFEEQYIGMYKDFRII
jgi:acylphosphatase